MSKVEVDCTKKCNSRLHGQALTSAITKRSVSDESLASFIKSTCANFTKAFDFEGRTALHMAASRGRNRLMEWLIRHSSDAFINAGDRESGYTPLHRSIFYGQIHTTVALMKLGVNTDILDKDDYKALEHAMLDKHYMWKTDTAQPCDAYVWGSNSNYTLGTGSHQPRQTPELLSCFSRSCGDVQQVCLGKFHSIWVCDGDVYCAGQPARAGGPHTTALRPILFRLTEPCVEAAITLTSTVFLMQSGAILQYSLNNTDTLPTKNPTTIKLPSVKPLIKLSCPLGVRAGRSHAVVWNARGIYTWGQNVGQLGHPQEEKVVPVPKRVAISLNMKDESTIQLVEACDAATVLTTSRGDVYLLHKHLVKKIAVKQINLRQVCVECKVSDQGVYSRVTVLLLTNVGQLMIWQDNTQRLTRCVFGLNHQTYVTHVSLTHDAVYFTTKYGEAFIGHISRKATPPAPQPIRRERERDNKSALVKFLEKDDCTPVRITKIPNIHRATAIVVDGEGLNFACLQMKPTCGLQSVPMLSVSSMTKHMATLAETAAADDILHDVVFRVGAKLYPAHMFIVASSSEYLYKLYCEQTDKTVVLDIHPDIFERILTYMYTGTCDVAEPGSCGLKIRREDLKDVGEKKEDEMELIENASEISAFEVYKRDKRRRAPAGSTLDAVKCVQAAAKRLRVMGLHKLLEKFYYRDGRVHLKENAVSTPTTPTWMRESFPDLVDTNVCSKDGVLIPAHRCVLAARLDYFHGMFSHSWTESKTLSTVTLPVNHGILLPLIDFLYTDECPEILTSDSIDFICSMLIVSDQLFVCRLREMCEIALFNFVTLKNCAELCQFAHTHNATQLKQSCMEFIALNMNNILENRSLDLLEEELLEDISKYYCKFNPIMSSRVITPFYNCPSDDVIEECFKTCLVDLDHVDEEFKKDISNGEKEKKKKQKKIEYTESEKVRMRYESVSSHTSLDLKDNSSDALPISTEDKTKGKETEKWTKVPTPKEKQQKVVQARLKAISSAKDIMNETPTNTFTKLTKNNSNSAISESLNNSKETKPWGQGNLIISHVGPKLSQKQRKKLASESENSSMTLDEYLGDRLSIGSPPDKPKNPWKIIEPVASSSPNKTNIEFNKILADQKKQKDDSSRIMTKPLALTQLEDKAIEELERFYNIHEIDDELISVRRIELQVSSPQWINTAPK